MKYFLWFVLFITCVIGVLFLTDKALGGTLEEYTAIASKYNGYDSITEEKESYQIVYIIDKKSELVAFEIINYNKIPLMFFEKIGEVFGCVWIHPNISKRKL